MCVYVLPVAQIIDYVQVVISYIISSDVPDPGRIVQDLRSVLFVGVVFVALIVLVVEMKVTKWQ